MDVSTLVGLPIVTRDASVSCLPRMPIVIDGVRTRDGTLVMVVGIEEHDWRDTLGMLAPSVL